MAEESENGKAMKREFVLAGSIFVAMAVVGTAFGLWMVTSFTASQPPQPSEPPAAEQPAAQPPTEAQPSP